MNRFVRSAMLSLGLVTCLALSAHAADDTVDDVANTLFNNGVENLDALCPATLAADDLTACRAEKMKTISKLVSEKAWALTAASCPQVVVDCAEGYHLGNIHGHDKHGCPLAPVCEKDAACPVGKHLEVHVCTTGDCSGVPAQFCVDDAAITPVCPVYQQPICAAGSYVQAGTTKANGCTGAPTCVADPSYVAQTTTGGSTTGSGGNGYDSDYYGPPRMYNPSQLGLPTIPAYTGEPQPVDSGANAAAGYFDARAYGMPTVPYYSPNQEGPNKTQDYLPAY